MGPAKTQRDLKIFKSSKVSMNQRRPVRPNPGRLKSMTWSRGVGRILERTSNLDIRLQNTNINFT